VRRLRLRRSKYRHTSPHVAATVPDEQRSTSPGNAALALTISHRNRPCFTRVGTSPVFAGYLQRAVESIVTGRGGDAIQYC